MIRKQIARWIAVVLVSWYGMMAVHEAGHCIGAAATGATIDKVEIPFAGFSRTDFSGGKGPLLVVWAGPLLGVTLPFGFLVLLNTVGAWARHAIQFFVGFCLVANGAYIGMGAFSAAGDCGRMLAYGSPVWLLVSFGAASLAGGFYTWHKMGPTRGWFADSPEEKRKNGSA